MNPKTTLFLILGFLLCSCAPEKERASLQTISLANNTDTEIAYAVSVNGQNAKMISLQPKQGILFWGRTPTLQPAKAEFRNSEGEKMGFRGTNIRLQTVKNSDRGVSPQGIFSSFRFYTGDAVRASKEGNWKDLSFDEFLIIDIEIKKAELNKAVEPTTMRVTDPANAGSAPRMLAAHF
jgi:hypothetical protein